MIATEENYQQKTLCVLLVDHSKATADKIEDINHMLRRFYEDILESDSACPRIEITLISCDIPTRIIQQPSIVENFTMPTLNAKNDSNIIDGIKMAIEVVEGRKQYYREQGIPYKRPWIIIISNGECDAESIKNNLKQLVDFRDEAIYNKRYFIQSIAIDENADMNVLDFVATNKTIFMKDAKFLHFFRWLSGSLAGDFCGMDSKFTEFSIFDNK